VAKAVIHVIPENRQFAQFSACREDMSVRDRRCDRSNITNIGQ